MSKIIKRKYRKDRKAFKQELHELAQSNKAIPIMIVETYTASQHRRHIMQIWELLGLHHGEAYKDYCNKLMGKTLTGRDEILHSLYFVDEELCRKYTRKIPERFAMGDALAVAYRVLKGR